ncbi:hypothetical protein [Methanoculleus chikugoensis]|nr:hypothetical protein [Methanoculleus chikugoensis]
MLSPPAISREGAKNAKFGRWVWQLPPFAASRSSHRVVFTLRMSHPSLFA